MWRGCGTPQVDYGLIGSIKFNRCERAGDRVSRAGWGFRGTYPLINAFNILFFARSTRRVLASASYFTSMLLISLKAPFKMTCIEQPAEICKASFSTMTSIQTVQRDSVIHTYRLQNVQAREARGCLSFRFF
jgi:hypothetical protein